jgi:hypothetical protein
MAGLRDRLLRHPSDQKKRRWHIDYFLNDKQARIKKIFLYLAAPGQDAVNRTSPPVYFSTVHSVLAPNFPRAAWKDLRFFPILPSTATSLSNRLEGLSFGRPPCLGECRWSNRTDRDKYSPRMTD